MADKVKISQDAFQKAISELQTAKGLLENDKAEMSKKYSSMRADWQGLAGEAFESRSQTIIKQFEVNMENKAGKAHFLDTDTYGPLPPVVAKGVSIDSDADQKAFQGVGDYDGASGLQCVDLSRWFIDKYTTLSSTAGHGRDLAANTASKNNLSAPSTVPGVPSVFSVVLCKV